MLNFIEEIGKEVRPTYAGSKMAQERLKKSIILLTFFLLYCYLLKVFYYHFFIDFIDFLSRFGWF